MARSKTFYIYKLIKIFKVFKNENLIFAASWTVSTGLKNYNNSSKFIVITFIFSFGLNHSSWKVGYYLLYW